MPRVLRIRIIVLCVFVGLATAAVGQRLYTLPMSPSRVLAVILQP